MNVKKIITLLLAALLVLSLAACGSQETTSDDSGDGSSPKYLIGISQYGQHGSLDNCREGFLQGLEQAGLVEGTDFEVDTRTPTSTTTRPPKSARCFPPRTRT